MEKRVFVAAALSAVFLVLYAQVMGRMSRPQKALPQTTTTESGAGAQEKTDATAHETTSIQLIDNEQVTVMESEQLILEIGETSGDIRQVTMKGFRADDGVGTVSVSTRWPLIGLREKGERLLCRLLGRETGAIKLECEASSGEKYNISYVLDGSNRLLHGEIERYSGTEIGESVEIVASWSRIGNELAERNKLEAVFLSEEARGKRSYARYGLVHRTEKHVPRGTLVASITEQYFSLCVKSSSAALSSSVAPNNSHEEGAILLRPASRASTYGFSVYFGPKDYFYLRETGLEQAFPIGVLGRIGLVLLLVLNWGASVTGNYGIGIIVLSGIVTSLTAPFTLLGIRSMKKMQELKPRVDKVMSDHKGDPARVNREIMALYKEHRVSPFSGCLPLLLQMPIFIALFQAISHYIELRGKRFLWIEDLSLPDRAWELSVSLPILGRDVNALPILTAVAMYAQMKFSQAKTPTAAADPMTKIMSGPLMAVMFGVMFYQFPSGLVLYWLTNSAISVAWYRSAR